MAVEIFVDVDGGVIVLGPKKIRDNAQDNSVNNIGCVKPRIYFSKTQKCWKVAHMNRAGNEWRAYYAAFNFCHKLNVRLMEVKNAE